MSIAMEASGALRVSVWRPGRRWVTAVGLLAVVCGPAALWGQTVTLQAVADATIKQGSPNQTFGGQKTLALRESGVRVLVRFDPEAIAAAVGSGSLASAQLQLYIDSNAANWGPTGRTADLYRLDAAWSESGATWNCANDANPGNGAADCAAPWSGGTVEDDASDTVVLTNTSSGWIQFDVTADVQAFLAGTADDGWLLQKTDEGQAGRVELVSREGTAGLGPRLVLTSESAAYDTVPPSLAIVAPAQPIVVNVASPPIILAYQDGGSGVDTTTLHVLLDGQDMTAACTVFAQGATCVPPPLAAGTHTVGASLHDRAGNAASASRSFRLLVGPSVNTLTFPVAGDTFITQHAADKEHGRAAFLRVAKSGPCRALAQFDPAALAAALAGNQLLAAQLELPIAANGNNWGASGRAVGAYRLSVAWSEAAATWDCAADANLANGSPDCAAPWNGGVFAASPVATALITRNLAGTVAFDVTADVAAFLGGATNAGWLLAKTDEATSGRIDFASREATPGQPAAQLTVVFQVPSADTTPPAIAAFTPASGSFVPTATPAIGAAYADAGSGVDPASVHLTVDGVDVTAAAQVSATAASFTPASPLADGAHTATLTLEDRAGNQAQAATAFTVDTAPPSLAIVYPDTPRVTGAAGGELLVELAYADALSGVDPASVTLAVDGADASANCVPAPTSAGCNVPALAAGTHRLAAAARDLAGNPASATASFQLIVDSQPPAILIATPATGIYTTAASVTVTGTATDDVGVTRVTVDDQPATLAGGAFQATVSLVEGTNDLVAAAFDGVGNQTTARVTVIRDTHAPYLALDSPPLPALTNAASATVSGHASDENGLASLTVNGVAVSLPLAPDTFSVQVPLAAGANAVTVVASDPAGNATTAAAAFTRYVLPSVTISAPADLSYLAATTVTVSGTVSDPAASVTVNGVAATMAGSSFTAAGVPLVEGGNTLTATATLAGAASSATVNVVRDLTPPHLSIDYPASGAILADATVTVSGLVNDIVAGTVNAGQATVTVNGRPAVVANRSFVVDVPLTPGANTLTAVATDASGNVAQAAVAVSLDTSPRARLARVSGDAQQATISATLPQPLVVSLLDATGLPVAGKPVIFKVRGSNGNLGGGQRLIAVTTDASGRAAASFSLGSRAGAGNQVVEAAAAGYGTTPVVFHATALPGPPVLILADDGDQQVGIAGQQLPRPLVATVTDAGFNRLPGVTVDFGVVQGGGQLANGQQQMSVTTDSDGRAIVALVLDPAEGIANNVVRAWLDAAPQGSYAGFTATGRTAGDPAATSISGVVLDNAGQPIPGVTLRVLTGQTADTLLTAQSDPTGRFQIAAAPAGSVKLIADGTTATRPGPWPDLEFAITTVPGRDNTVNRPIYLLPLDQGNGLQVDETHGGTLTSPSLPGFALDIAAGSVTFPGGGKSGVVSVTVVHNDKVPMTPNFGQQPRLIVTIQPAGARFDPPARLSLPNVDGLPPGEVTEMYSFDHDLGHFVSIGPATVSDDGATVVANPGVGIVKAGWHCCGDPAATGATHDCPFCRICDGVRCIQDDSKVNKLCPPPLGTPRPPCSKPVCTVDGCEYSRLAPSKITLSLQASPLSVEPGQPVSFLAQVSPADCSAVPITFSTQAFGDGNGIGGHSHTGRPVNPPSPGACVTDASGQCRGAYRTGIAAGTDQLNATTATASALALISVGYQGFLLMPDLADGNFDLVGQTAAHPSNHWTTSTTRDDLFAIANDYQAMFPQAEKLHFNDNSLVNGGVFDITTNWNQPHQLHRLGKTADIRLATIPAANRSKFVNICLNHHAVAQIHNGNHYHLDFHN